MPTPLKTNKQLLLLKIETTFNVDPTPTAAADAIQCEEPEYTLDSVVLERNFIKPHWSRTAHAMGRKLSKVKFTMEVKNGGTPGVQSKLGRCIQACGHRETLLAAAVTGTATAGSSTSITLAVGASAVNDAYRGLTLTVTGGTGSGSTGIITSYNGTTKVATVLSWSSTAPGASSTYSIEAGATYVPSSTVADHKSATIYLYKDGVLHIMTGCYGTVSFEGAVNGYGKATFEFIGQYYVPTDIALPTSPTFESTTPKQVESALMTIGAYAAVISKFSLDAGVEVLPRLDANGTDGYDGTYIGGRAPTGGIDPEATLVADQNFWDKLASATEMALKFRFGSVSGNIVRISAEKTQYTGLTYASRDKLQTLDAGLAFNQNAAFGDDEYCIALV
jgi:hypothetical protein